ncbi:Neocarzinostatin family protein OS=Streptomyces alboniger OX=132473 GN=CP975_14020 PE=4 SV=1 [Streptomyces alboniger]
MNGERRCSRRHRSGRRALGVLAVLALLGLGCALLPGPVASAADKPTVRLSRAEAGKGGSVTVTGSGWRPGALLMMLVCGQSEPGKGVIGGTDSCANSEGRAVTTDKDGAFSRKLPVAEPPEPCPCVVHVATVTGGKARTDTAFKVAGHPVKPLSEEATGGRLSALSGTRLEGSDGLLTWFGSPPRRTLVLTVGNVGTEPLKDPVFRVGTSHGVFAPQWEEQQWRGTLAPGEKARIKLPVQLPGGAHGDYLVSLRFGGQALAEQPWDVGRPWGVTVFWLLLCVVVPVAAFRVGMVIVDRLRPKRRGPSVRRRRRASARSTGRHAPGARTAAEGTLPWFTPDSEPQDPVRGAGNGATSPHDPRRTNREA